MTKTDNGTGSERPKDILKGTSRGKWQQRLNGAFKWSDNKKLRQRKYQDTKPKKRERNSMEEDNKNKQESRTDNGHRRQKKA
jgi:hypothetical protein